MCALLAYLSCDKRCNGHVVADFHEEVPDSGVPVLGQHLVVKPVHLGRHTSLVVTAENVHSVRVPNLRDKR